MTGRANFQGRTRGKSVSFRGVSNDSNFYETRPRGYQGNRDEEANYSGYSGYDNDTRTVKLLPDANMTISVQNDLRNRPRSGGRGIYKSSSFRDDTHIHQYASEFSDDRNHGNFRGWDGFRGRFRGRPRGIPNYQSQYINRSQDTDFDPNNRYFDYNRGGYRGNRGRNKSAPDRNRGFRFRSGGRYRKQSNSKSSDKDNEWPMPDGDKEDNSHNAADDDWYEDSWKQNEIDQIELDNEDINKTDAASANSEPDHHHHTSDQSNETSKTDEAPSNDEVQHHQKDSKKSNPLENPTETSNVSTEEKVELQDKESS